MGAVGHGDASRFQRPYQGHVLASRQRLEAARTQVGRGGQAQVGAVDVAGPVDRAVVRGEGLGDDSGALAMGLPVRPPRAAAHGLALQRAQGRQPVLGQPKRVHDVMEATKTSGLTPSRWPLAAIRRLRSTRGRDRRLLGSLQGAAACSLRS